MDDLTLKQKQNKLQHDFEATNKRINNPEFDTTIKNTFTIQFNHLCDFCTDGQIYDSILYYQEVEDGLDRINDEITKTWFLVNGTSKNLVNTVSNIVLHNYLPQTILYGDIVHNVSTNNLCDMVYGLKARELNTKQKVTNKIKKSNDPSYKIAYSFYLTNNQNFLDNRFEARAQFYKETHLNNSICKWATELNKIMNDYLTNIQVINSNQHLTKSRVKLLKDSQLQRDYFKTVSFNSAVPMYLVFRPIFKYLLGINNNSILHKVIGGLLLIHLISLPTLDQISMSRNEVWDNQISLMDSTTYLILMLVILDNFFTASPKPTKACIQMTQKLFKLDKASNKFFAD